MASLIQLQLPTLDPAQPVKVYLDSNRDGVFEYKEEEWAFERPTPNQFELSSLTEGLSGQYLVRVAMGEYYPGDCIGVYHGSGEIVTDQVIDLMIEIKPEQPSIEAGFDMQWRAHWQIQLTPLAAKSP